MPETELSADAMVIRFSPWSAEKVLERAGKAARRRSEWSASVFAGLKEPGEADEDLYRRPLAAADLHQLQNNDKFAVCARAGDLLELGFVFMKDGDEAEAPEHYSVRLGDSAARHSDPQLIVKVILADTGQQDSSGKTHLLGAGWNTTGLGPQGVTPDQAVAVFIEAPWDRCNRPIDFRLELQNQDGGQVHLPSGPPPAPSVPLLVQSVVTPVPPQGAPNGTAGTASFFASLTGGLPLAPGQSYSWRVYLDDATEEAWQTTFYVARQQQPVRFGPADASLPGY